MLAVAAALDLIEHRLEVDRALAGLQVLLDRAAVVGEAHLAAAREIEQRREARMPSGSMWAWLTV